MKLSLDATGEANVIRAYDQGWITVNEYTYRQSILLSPGRVVPDWPPQTFAAFTEADFAVIVELQPEIVLLGTGARLQFPAPQLLQALMRAGIGLEVMDTRAACSTYNIVMAEGRRVVAALLMI
jgi:uncharacterized protein